VVVGWIQLMEWATTLVEAGEHFAVQKPISSTLGFLVLKHCFRTLIFPVVDGFQQGIQYQIKHLLQQKIE
jgi:hypothetical protein